MNHSIKECMECKQPFEVLNREIKRGNGKFCSRSCSAKFGKKKNKPESNCQCAYCGKKLRLKPSRIKTSKSGLVFCSRVHKDLAQKLDGGIGAIYPAHYGKGAYVRYRDLLGPVNERKCNRCGYDKHPEIIIAHHIDRDRTNNCLKNIEALCSRCHDEEHFLAKDGRWT